MPLEPPGKPVNPIKAEESGQPIPPGAMWLRDAYRWVCNLTGDSDSEVAREAFLLAALRGSRGPDISHLRVAALNSLVKNFRSETALARGPRLLPPSGHSEDQVLIAGLSLGKSPQEPQDACDALTGYEHGESRNAP